MMGTAITLKLPRMLCSVEVGRSEIKVRRITVHAEFMRPWLATSPLPCPPVLLLSALVQALVQDSGWREEW